MVFLVFLGWMIKKHTETNGIFGIFGFGDFPKKLIGRKHSLRQTAFHFTVESHQNQKYKKYN